MNVDTLRKRRLMGDFTCYSVANHDSGVIIDAHVYTNSVVTRKLDDRVIGHDRENKNRCAVLNLHERQSHFTISKACIVEPENEAVPCAANHHFKDDFTIAKGVIILYHSILLIDGTKVNVVFAIRGCRIVYGALPALANVLIAFTVYGFDAFLPGTVRRNHVVLD